MPFTLWKIPKLSNDCQTFCGSAKNSNLDNGPDHIFLLKQIVAGNK
jgi:hypothetical protein